MKKPFEFDRRILLAVSGMSPQILTETLYALTVANGSSPFVPNEIHLISTREGKRRAVLELLHPKTGMFHLFCRDYGLDGITFNENNIHVIADASGSLLDDIVTPEQNEAAADFITDIVNRMTRDENSAIHVSIAGGRKTMGYYLGYALSLYGRQQDRMSHVLVTERYEGLHDFFYPTTESHVIYDRNKEPLDTRNAQVMLAEIPFVLMRAGIPEHLLDGKAGFSESIKFTRLFESEPKLEISVKKLSIHANGINIPFTLINFVFYLWMIDQTVKQENLIHRPLEPNRGYAESFISIYQSLRPALSDDDKTLKALTQGMEAQWLSERINAVKKSFEKTLGIHAASRYIIQSQGVNNNKTYALPLLNRQIFFR
ncbi:CRISPR-associated ring nuclease Csm6 [Methylotuvimicrobium sp. KM2]|uniref:CRISPR-associated ring nuclease Csm6 n=1 Tax=Methylotuvimicrobium sp. KM2 TaxID=3133976 RepID=UPI0031014118